MIRKSFSFLVHTLMYQYVHLTKITNANTRRYIIRSIGMYVCFTKTAICDKWRIGTSHTLFITLFTSQKNEKTCLTNLTIYYYSCRYDILYTFKCSSTTRSLNTMSDAPRCLCSPYRVLQCLV